LQQIGVFSASHAIDKSKTFVTVNSRVSIASHQEIKVRLTSHALSCTVSWRSKVNNDPENKIEEKNNLTELIIMSDYFE
jgi:hypothetical protein